MPTESSESHNQRGANRKPQKIALQDLYKAFGSNKVLRGVDLSLHEGESLVVMGGSGSGKSVMLKCLLGLMSADSGVILIDGRDVSHISGRRAMEARAHMGMLFQHGALFDSLRIWENVAFGLIHVRGMKRAEAREKAVATLADVGLDSSTADLWPPELSGGMQKRAALARAIAPSPDILLFDEPTTGLDPITAAIISDLIIRTVRRLGVSALSITHDMSCARRIGDRVAMLRDGRIIWSGRGGDLDASGDAYVDQFVHGRPER